MLQAFRKMTHRALAQGLAAWVESAAAQQAALDAMHTAACKLFNREAGRALHAWAEAVEEALRARELASSSLHRLRNRLFGMGQMAAVCRVVVSNATLRSVDLSNNALGDEAVGALISALRRARSVEALDLRDNRMSWKTCHALDQQADSGVLARLVALRVGANPLGDRGVALLARAIKRCGRASRLEALDVSRTGMGESGGEALADLLENHGTLRELRLGWNNIGRRGCRAMGAALRADSTLLLLDLSHCGVSNDGAQHIARALETNDVLQELLLVGNGVGESSAHVLGHAATRPGCALRRVDVSTNPLTRAGAAHLLKMCYYRQGIELCITNCNLTPVVGRGKAFNPRKPDGEYVLGLHEPSEHMVATKLAELRNKHGADSWLAVTLDGGMLSHKVLSDWPERMPEKGELKLRFKSVLASTRLAQRVLSPEAFDAVWTAHVSGSAGTDAWRLQLVHSIAHARLDVRCKQLAEIVRSMEWSTGRVEVASVLFARLADPANVYTALEDVMLPAEYADFKAALGPKVLAFTAENPTGEYELNLEKFLDRFIASSLLNVALDEQADGVAKLYATAPDRPILSMTINGKSVLEKWSDAPHDYELPAKGALKLVYVSQRRPLLNQKPINDDELELVMQMICAEKPASSREVISELLRSRKRKMVQKSTKSFSAGSQRARHMRPSVSNMEEGTAVVLPPSEGEKKPWRITPTTARDAALVLRAVSPQLWLSADQAAAVVEAFPAAGGQRENAAVSLFRRTIEIRGSLGSALARMGKELQMAVCARMGWHNSSHPIHPAMYYRLRLNHLLERRTLFKLHRVACARSEIATADAAEQSGAQPEAAKQSAAFTELTVDGLALDDAEARKFVKRVANRSSWNNVRNSVVEFRFVSDTLDIAWACASVVCLTRQKPLLP